MKILSITLLAIFSILVGCSTTQTSGTDNIKVDNEISVNETFQISLESNPSTGYSWKWTNKKSVSAVDSVDSEYIGDKPVLTGSGGKEVWKFKGVKRGIDTLKLEYYRTWDRASTANTKTVIVRVK